MAKGGKVQHWKHGWIPVSPEARAFAAHKGPRPATGAKRAALPQRGDPDWSPNNEFGIPSRKVADHADDARLRAQDIQDLVPEISPRPHLQFASQNIPAHHTGGVVIDARDVDLLLDKLANTSEGPMSRLDAAKAAGGRLPVNATKGSAEEQAKRRARRLKQELGLSFGPMPEYVKVDPQATFGGNLRVMSGYTGGLVFDPPTADELIRNLGNRTTGTMTRLAARRAAGVGRF